MFILHLSAILCAGILLLCLVNSLAGLIMNLRRHGGRAIGALAIAAISMATDAVAAPGDVAVAALSSNVEYPPVTVFGMAEWQANAVPKRPATLASRGAGQQLFEAQCIACHGADAGGIDSIGVSLTNSSFVVSSSQDELIAFLKVGRMPNDPATITGLVMPGFAWIAEQDLAALAAYVKKFAE